MRVRRILALALAALLLGSAAWAETVYGALESDIKGYESRYLELVSSERQTLQGATGELPVYCAKYRYIGDKEFAWKGYPYLYGMYDPERNIHVSVAKNDEKGVKKDHRPVFWAAGETCEYPWEVEALYDVTRAYDYYSNLGWVGSADNGAYPIYVYTDVTYMDEDHVDYTLWNNAGAYYDPDEHLTRIYIGRPEKGTLPFEVIAHEYTHTVLMGHGVIYAGAMTQTGAIHEGYADVMGVCASGADWDMYEWRKLSGGGKDSIYHTRDFDYVNGTECHAAALILGHAAYLMAEELEGEALTKLQIAKLFLKSMDYLGSTPGFDEAGAAIYRAAKALRKEKDESNSTILSKGQLRRVQRALEAVGLLKEGEVEPEPTEAPMDVDDILKKGLKALKKKYGTVKTGEFKGAKVPSAQQLEGIIAAKRKDFDGDGAKELLVWRLESWSTDALQLHLEMYEATGGKCALADSRTLRLPGLMNVMGRMSSSAAGFVYKHSGRWCLGVDTYYGVNESTVTVALYAYSEKKGFQYLAGGCHEAWGEGSIEVRQAKKEPSERYALFGASWQSLADGAKTPWKTVKVYDIEEHDWKYASADRKKKLYKAFREIIADGGVRSAGDRRVIPPEEPKDSAKFRSWWEKNLLQDLGDIYGETEGFEAQWRVVSWEWDNKARMLVEGD